MVTVNTLIEWCFDEDFPITCRIWEKQAEMCLAQLFIDFDWELNLTRCFAELFHFILCVLSKAMNARDLTLLLASMKIQA